MRMRVGRSRDREGGAALVEFAVLAPLLLLLVLGIVEFGYTFGQYNGVRHAAREGARYAAVDGGTNPQIARRVCESTEGLGAGVVDLELDQLDRSLQVDEPMLVQILALEGERVTSREPIAWLRVR